MEIIKLRESKGIKSFPSFSFQEVVLGCQACFGVKARLGSERVVHFPESCNVHEENQKQVRESSNMIIKDEKRLLQEAEVYLWSVLRHGCTKWEATQCECSVYSAVSRSLEERPPSLLPVWMRDPATVSRKPFNYLLCGNVGD